MFFLRFVLAKLTYDCTCDMPLKTRDMTLATVMREAALPLYTHGHVFMQYYLSMNLLRRLQGGDGMNHLMRLSKCLLVD